MTELKDLGYEQFRSWLHDNFLLRVEQPGSDLTLVLEAAESHPSHDTASGARQAFSLIFSGPLEPLLPQAVYPLEHSQAGKLDLFLVPLGPRDDRQQYEAVFS